MVRVGKQRLTQAELVVIAWSGLRGSVSLAMAIIVDMEPAIPKKMGSRIMFLVGGLATLTTIINATTTAQLLSWLGISQTPWVKQQMIEQCRKTMKNKTKDEFIRIVGDQEESVGTESVGLASMAIGHYS